ncbi:SGNH/GDSL hydrolase family protein [Blastococcus haudaquaticus]|uniref:Lysophospholipase L1 n=1 Tax=Blastococcus haudaquaticus TaxID=1938745 RepID=A0A286GYS1_9ACTN|nr:SGNH/GDSL hydrolase family protein [Blastococcus haudaquaticus]SOE00356.1 Lysophospholipase L1 [Blastococcus haudaquaticus]
MARGPGRPGPFARLPLPGRTEGIVILVVLLVTAIAVGAAAWYAGTRTTPAFDSPDDAAEAGAPPPTATPPNDEPPGLAVYGDWYVSGTALGGAGPAGWPAIVSQRLGAQATEPHAVTDAGYVAASDRTGDTFLSLAENFPEPRADVTVVFGSRNDYSAAPAEITAAATRTLETIRATAPETELLVIGPAWTDADVPPELPPVTDAVRQAAAAVGATFVDPLEERWFFDNPELIGADVISPTDEGHRYLADRIEPFVRQVLEENATSPSSETVGPTG